MKGTVKRLTKKRNLAYDESVVQDIAKRFQALKRKRERSRYGMCRSHRDLNEK